MNPRQFFVSLIISLAFLAIIIRLIQKGRLDISYCWLWLAVGIMSFLIVIKFDWLLRFSHIIGVVDPISALFLFSILALFLMCLQYSIIISSQRRQIKKLTQQIALLSENRET